MDEVLKLKWKYDDPHPDERGLLLSDQIDELCNAGLIISSGYDRQFLKPASYTLTVGENYIDSNGKQQRLSKSGDSFIFKKNSIVYVSAAEEFDLPYYIIARFNLRVHWVYEGILLGTGPQVDPGFRGRLSCPLYNLTNLDITIKRGQPFATIDFEKTTRFLGNISDEQKKQLLKEGVPKGFIETNGRFFKLYGQKPLTALEHHPNHVLISSLAEMRNEVRTWRNVGLGLVVAFIALTLSLLSFGSNIYRQLVDNLKEVEQSNTRIQLLEQKTTKAESSGLAKTGDANAPSEQPKPSALQQKPAEKH
jgi:deoxycytidine triphosphate deaminase